MAISFVGAGAPVYATSHVGAPYPAGIQAGDLLVFCTVMKGASSNQGITAQPGWFYGGLRDGSAPVAPGIDVGRTESGIFCKFAVGNETGTSPPMVIGSPNVTWSQITAYRKSPEGQWRVAVFQSATNDTVGDATMSANMQLWSGDLDQDTVWSEGARTFPNFWASGEPVPGRYAAGDWLHVMGGTPTDVGAGNAFSNYQVDLKGCVTGSFVEIAEPFTSLGQDLGGWIARGQVLSGTSEQYVFADSHAFWTSRASVSGTTTNQYGLIHHLRMRELLPGPAPTGVTASTGQLEQITVTWLDEPTASKYHVYRDGALIGSVNDPTLTFIDTEALGLTPTVNHSYTVRAEQPNGAFSPDSVAAIGRSDIGVVKDLSAGAKQTGEIQLKWSNKTYPAAYRITRDGLTITTTPVQATSGIGSYVDTGRTADVVHDYRVYVVYNGQEGPETFRQAAAAIVKLCRLMENTNVYGGAGGTMSFTNSATQTPTQQMRQHPSQGPVDLNRYVQLSVSNFGRIEAYWELQSPFWLANVIDASQVINQPNKSAIMDPDWYRGMIWKKPVKLGFYITGYDFTDDQNDYVNAIVWGGGSGFTGPDDGAIVGYISRSVYVNNILAGRRKRPELVGQWAEIEYDWSNRTAVKSGLTDDPVVFDQENDPRYAREWNGWGYPEPPELAEASTDWGEGARIGMTLQCGSVPQTVRIHGLYMEFAVGVGPLPPEDLRYEGLQFGKHVLSFVPRGAYPNDGSEVMQYGFTARQQGHAREAERPAPAFYADGRRRPFGYTPYELENPAGFTRPPDETGRVYWATTVQSGQDRSSGDLNPFQFGVFCVSVIGNGQQAGPIAPEPESVIAAEGRVANPSNFAFWPKEGSAADGTVGVATYVVEGENGVPAGIERSDSYGTLATAVLTNSGNSSFGLPVKYQPKVHDLGARVPFTYGVPFRQRLRMDTTLWTPEWPYYEAHPPDHPVQGAGNLRAPWVTQARLGADDSTAFEMAVWQVCQRMYPIEDTLVQGRVVEDGSFPTTVFTAPNTPSPAYVHVDENVDAIVTDSGDYAGGDFRFIGVATNSSYPTPSAYEAKLSPLSIPAGHEVREVTMLAFGQLSSTDLDSPTAPFANGQVFFELYQGGTLIKSVTGAALRDSQQRSIAPSITRNHFHQFRLTAAERAAITNWSDLRLRIRTNRIGSAFASWQVSMMDLRVQMAPVGYVAPVNQSKSSSDVAVGDDNARLLVSKVGSLPPDAVVESSGATGDVDLVQDDPASPDALWIEGVQPDVRVSFPTPDRTLHLDGENAFRARLRP